MTKKALAAFLSGYGVAFPFAWLIRHQYGESSMYVVAGIALGALLLSYRIDKLRDE